LSSSLDNKFLPLKKTYLSLFMGCIFIIACRKESYFAPAETCESQTANPAGRSYATSSFVPVIYAKKQCGILPLSNKNYWIYQDSVFNEGSFERVQYDTLRYTSTWKSLSDNLIWWESNISLGLPERLYANDSSIFQIDNRLFSPDMMDVKKEYGLFPGDSIRYLTNFEDYAALGRSVKVQTTFKSPAGNFDNYILFEKNARNFRKDQVYFKPGLGVIKYIMERASLGSTIIKLQQVSTLVAFHIE